MASSGRAPWQERFLKGVRDNFLIQTLVPTRGHVQLDQLFTNKKELVEDVIINGNFVWNDCELVEFKILRRMREISSRVYILYVRGAAFSLFRKLVDRITQEETTLKGKGDQEGWEGYQPNTRMVHPRSQENKQMSQEVSLTKQTTHGGIPMEKKKGSIQEVEAERGY